MRSSRLHMKTPGRTRSGTVTRAARRRSQEPPVRDRALDNTVPGSKPAGLAFFDQAMNLLQELKRTQADVIQKAAELCADRISRGGLVFLFGNGHSRMMSEEMTPRQGGYVGFVALVELAISNHSAIVGPNGLRAPLYLENYEG